MEILLSSLTASMMKPSVSILAAILVALVSTTAGQNSREVREVYRDANAVLYFNTIIDRTKTEWIFSLYRTCGKHARENFGPFRNSEGGRLKGIFQATAGEGGMAGSVNPKNAEIYMDISPGSIRQGNLYDRADKKGPNQALLFKYQVDGISQIIEEANNGMEGSPASSVWGTKGWPVIALYDIYLNSGLEKDAEDWKRSKINERVDAATAKNQVFWLRDWWLPIYDKYGKTQILSKFFKLLARYWPKRGNRYQGNMSVGEFVHFFSGAAETDLIDIAKHALGWEDEDEQSLANAKRKYNQIRY